MGDFLQGTNPLRPLPLHHVIIPDLAAALSLTASETHIKTNTEFQTYAEDKTDLYFRSDRGNGRAVGELEQDHSAVVPTCSRRTRRHQSRPAVALQRRSVSLRPCAAPSGDCAPSSPAHLHVSKQSAPTKHIVRRFS